MIAKLMSFYWLILVNNGNPDTLEKRWKYVIECLDN